jgi:4'-phosphopantetheinyl transferase
VPGSRLRVSASHAGDRVAVAVSTRGTVGIDVEPPRARPLSRALLRRTLGQGELEYLLGLPESPRRREFLRIWTAKEAILKATGEGLHGGPSRLALDLRATPLRLQSWAGSTARADTVRLVELEPGGDHVATLATLGADGVSVVHRDGRALVERMTA